MGWDKLATTWAVFQGLLIGALPFLLIGVGIASLVRWFSPAGGWLRRLPADPLLGPLTGAALGFALPACECGNVPVARRLIASGAPMATAFGFLFAAPVLNPIVLASTWAAFPDRPWLLLARPLAALAIALALASLLRLLPEGELLSDELLEERRLNQPLGQLSLLERRGGLLGERPQQPLGPQRMAAAEALGHGVREFLNLATLLVFGCAIASLVQTLVPRSWLLAVGDAPTLSILSLMLLAVLVSVCSSVDAFLALGFAAHVTPGALLAFLILGPVIDLKSLSLFGVVLRPGALALTVAGTAVVVLLICQWINLWQL